MRIDTQNSTSLIPTPRVLEEVVKTFLAPVLLPLWEQDWEIRKKMGQLIRLGWVIKWVIKVKASKCKWFLRLNAVPRCSSVH